MGVLVCDLGFSSVKWMYEDRKGRIISAFRYDGENLLVGEEALLSSGSSYLKTMEELVRYYPVFVGHCEKAAKVEGEIDLAVGLPFSYWQEQNKPGGAVPALAKSLIGGQIKDVAIFPVTSRVELGKLSRPVLGGTDGFVPSCKRRISPLKQPGTNG